MSRAVLQLFLLSSTGLVAAGPDPAASPTARAQAVLDQHCVKCHGPLEEKAGLFLDTPEAALAGSENGPVIVPGRPDESLLIQVLAPDADPHMPPKKQLAEAETAALRDWVVHLGAPPAPAPAASTLEATTAPDSIDGFLEAAWRRRGITPAPPADDRTFLRRVTLDLIGRIPTPEEAEAFLYDPSPAKRTTLVDRLLATDEAARHFREVWDALLMGRRDGRRESRRRDNGWFAFLEEGFKTGRPWTETVAAMITARPATPQDRGALWFVFERRNEHQQIAEAIAPVIYGTRIDCAQCHDHPLAREIKQGHYWGLVAAFNRSKNVEGGAPAVNESAVGGFINFTNLRKESQPAVLAMLTGTTIEESRPDSGAKEEDRADLYLEPAAAVKVPRFSRRAALARAATQNNPLLARSFVNHAWALLLGRGLVHPVDQMNSKHPPSDPALLDWLAADFAAHNHDVRHVIRQIVLSRAYQLAASTGTDPPPPPPPADAFAAASERPLTAEAIARSARLAAGHAPDDDTLRQAVAARFPDVLPGAVRATIQQAMFLANDDTFAGLFNPGPAAEALTSLPTPEARARAVFRRTLLRDPDAAELDQARTFLLERTDAPAQAVGQLLWALVSGPEFLTNH
jgi:mono/diheme cytochrome c family protein